MASESFICTIAQEGGDEDSVRMCGVVLFTAKVDLHHLCLFVLLQH